MPLSPIPLSDCKDRRLYRVSGRNIEDYAIFDARHDTFWGFRFKFYHYRVDHEQYRICLPLEEMPDEVPATLQLTYITVHGCKECRGLVTEVDGVWRHDGEVHPPHDVDLVGFGNPPLHEWLRDTQIRHGVTLIQEGAPDE